MPSNDKNKKVKQDQDALMTQDKDRSADQERRLAAFVQEIIQSALNGLKQETSAKKPCAKASSDGSVERHVSIVSNSSGSIRKYGSLPTSRRSGVTFDQGAKAETPSSIPIIIDKVSSGEKKDIFKPPSSHSSLRKGSQPFLSFSATALESQLSISMAGFVTRYTFHLPPITGPNSTGQNEDSDDTSTSQTSTDSLCEEPKKPMVKPKPFRPYADRDTYTTLPPIRNLPWYPQLPCPCAWGVPITPCEPRTVLVGHTCPEAFKFNKGIPMSMTSYITRRHYNRPCMKPSEWIHVPLRKRQ